MENEELAEEDITADEEERSEEDREENGAREFKVVKAKFKYGKYDDEVGMLMAIFGPEEVKSWNLIMTDDPESQLTPVDGDYIIFKRIFDGNSIKDKKRSYNIKQQIREELEEKPADLITATPEEIEDFFDRNLHLVVKEEVDLDLVVEEIGEKRLREDFPELFVQEDEEEEKEEEEETVISCSVSIAPISGKKLAKVKISDQIVLKFTENKFAQWQEELAEITAGENKVVGTIEEIDYNPEEEEYIFLVKFVENVYGKATVEANSNMKLEVPTAENEDDWKVKNPLYDTTNIILLIILVIMFIALLITMN